MALDSKAHLGAIVNTKWKPNQGMQLPNHIPPHLPPHPSCSTTGQGKHGANAQRVAALLPWPSS
eukprot:2889878-Pyramimonas_sp.AAC.1